MKNFKLFLFVFFLFAVSSKAQLQVVSTSPANGEANVAAGQTISITFNEPLDPTMNPGDGDDNRFIISNTAMELNGGFNFSSDHKTIILPIQTGGSHDYNFCFYGIRSESGDTLQTPYVYRFTTETSFTGVNISGKITSCDPNLSVANTMVILYQGEKDGPDFSVITTADDEGNYNLSYVKNGEYGIVAFKDVDNNGGFGGHDRILFSTPVIVQGSDVVNFNLNFPCLHNYSFREIATMIDSAANVVHPNDSLWYAFSDDFTPDGNVYQWNFIYRDAYNGPGNVLNRIRYNEQWGGISYYDNWGWYDGEFTSTDLGVNVFSAADPSSFIQTAEANGGAEFRRQTIPPGYELNVELDLGRLSDLNYNPPDDGLYWGLRYVIEDGGYIYKEKEFIADLETGQIVLINGVDDNSQVPAKFELEQNYPNPFNPSTNINFTISAKSNVKLSVYNLLGQKVATLMDKPLTAGQYHVTFNGSDLPSGIYFYRLQSGKYSQTRKMLLMK